VKPRVIRTSSLRTAVVTGVPLGLAMAPLFGLVAAGVGTLVLLGSGCAGIGAAGAWMATLGGIGALTALPLGLLMAVYSESILASGTEPALEDGERLRALGPANHVGPGDPASGRLFLTDRRLRFVSRGMRRHDDDTSWPLADVGELSSGVLRDRLLVEIGERTEEFLVADPAAWIAEIVAATRQSGS
jgi:hypothetical protein